MRYVPFLFSWCATGERNQFASVHHVSWGAKGDNKVSTDLGVVSADKGEKKNEVEVAVPTAEANTYAADPATEQEDCYKTFRMNALLVWTWSNVNDNQFEWYRAIL